MDSISAMTDSVEFNVIYPDYFDDPDVLVRGVVDGIRVQSGGREFDISFFSPTRLSQEVEGEVLNYRHFFVQKNLVVVTAVDRGHINAAVAELAKLNFAELRAEDGESRPSA
jgi:hypothetical protein